MFERTNRNLVGKGYALDYMFKKILSSDDDSDAFIVFDADNLIDREYIAEMNKTFGLGFEAITRPTAIPKITARTGFRPAILSGSCVKRSI